MKSNILQKIQGYCAQTEKSSVDVLHKLHQWGIGDAESDEILKHLIAEGFVNDVRYLSAFVGDKWRIHQWGREKIRLAIEALQIPDADIESAMSSIPEEPYIRMVHDLLMRKYNSISHAESLEIQHKILQYAYAKGFELPLAHAFLEELGIDSDTF